LEIDDLITFRAFSVFRGKKCILLVFFKSFMVNMYSARLRASMPLAGKQCESRFFIIFAFIRVHSRLNPGSGVAKEGKE